MTVMGEFDERLRDALRKEVGVAVAAGLVLRGKRFNEGMAVGAFRDAHLAEAFGIGGHDLPAGVAGRPAAFVIEPVVHAEGGAFLDHFVDEIEIRLGEIGQVKPGRHGDRAEFRRLRMEADGLQTMRGHVLKLRFADFCVNLVVDDPEIGDGAFGRRIIEVVSESHGLWDFGV